MAVNTYKNMVGSQYEVKVMQQGLLRLEKTKTRSITIVS